jgi:hypothetical protein
LKILLATAAVFIVFAAVGLAAETGGDPCANNTGEIEDPGSASHQYWPPGVTCSYDAPDGQELIVEQNGHIAAVFAILVAGLLLVLGRRSKLAIATAFVFGAGGLAGFYLGFAPIPIFNENPVLYAVLLLIIAMLPQRAEVVSQTVRSH